MDQRTRTQARIRTPFSLAAMVGLLAAACAPAPSASPQTTIKPGPDVALSMRVEPQYPRPGDELSISITAKAHVDADGLRIDLSLPRDVTLTGAPIQWTGDLALGQELTLETQARVESVPLTEPIRATLWFGSTPQNTVAWPAMTAVDAPLTSLPQKPGRPAEMALDYEQRGDVFTFSASVTALEALDQLRGSFVLPDMFSVTSGAQVWDGALTAGETVVLSIEAHASGEPHGTALFRLETFGAGTLEVDIPFDVPSPEQLAEQQAAVPRGTPAEGNLPPPNAETDKAPDGGPEVESMALARADITIVADPYQPALGDTLELLIYIHAREALGNSSVAVELPPVFETLNGEAAWHGMLKAGERRLVSMSLQRTGAEAGEIVVRLQAEDGGLVEASSWFGAASAPGESPSTDVSALAGTLYLSGRFAYAEDLGDTDLGAYYNLVYVYDEDGVTDEFVCAATTNAFGFWNCTGTAADPFDDTLELYPIVYAYNFWYGQVSKPSLLESYAYQGWVTNANEAGDTTWLGEWFPPFADGYNWDGAWHIMRQLGYGNALSEYEGLDAPPTADLHVVWPSTYCGASSCYGDAYIWVLGPGSTDHDEWDESVIIHEYGHYIHDLFADVNPPTANYCHDPGESPCVHSWGSNEDPATAYIEGWASYFQAAARRAKGLPSPEIYSDDWGPGTITNNFEEDCWNRDVASTWNDNEGTVICILWDINDLPDDDQNGDGAGDTIDMGYNETHNTFSRVDPDGAGSHNTPWNIDEYYTAFQSTNGVDSEVRSIYFENGINKDMTFNLSVLKNGQGTGNAVSSPAGLDCGFTCYVAFPYNTIITLTASPTGASVFAGWSLAGCPGTGSCSFTMTTAQTVTATFNPIGLPDAYEDDDIPNQAKVISPAWPQNHSISELGEHDWVKFVLASPSNVTLRTNGPAGYVNDTRLFLYDSTLTELAFDDDSGLELYSVIRRCGDNKLPIGEYYVMVDEWGGDALIPNYQLLLTNTCHPTGSDFDGDGKSDPVKFNPGTGFALWLKSSTGQWSNADVGVDASSYVRRSDFDGDTRTDPAKYVDAGQGLYYLRSSDSTWQSVYMGSGSYSMLPGSDFDGDQKTDPAKYLPAAGAIWRLPSSVGTWVGTYIGYDAAPVLSGSDYDGDGRTDLAKYVPAAGAIWFRRSSTGIWEGTYIGSDGAPVAGSDFDGDGRTDPAKYVASANALWYFETSSATWKSVYLGPGPFEYVTASDFDGDGKTDPAKYVPSAQALWYFKSTTGSWQGVYVGGIGPFEVVN